MAIDLCVISYNTKDKLRRMVDILHSDGREGWNLYILDNMSTDGTQEWLTENQKRYDIKYLRNQADNVGYARACNFLARLGDGDIIGLLNADVWLYTKDIEQIQKTFDKNPNIDILGPKQRDELGRITHAGIFGTLAEPKHRGWHEKDIEDDLYRDLVPAVTVSGAAYFVRRKVWEELTACQIYRSIHPNAEGAFLPTPHYYEETFCSYHAHAHNYGVYYDGRISIGHSWHASSRVGGTADGYFNVSREIFREMCDIHSIPHD